MSFSKRSRFRVQKQNLLRRPSLTDEQNRVWSLVEKTGSPQGAASDLVSRLMEMEAQVAAWEQSVSQTEPQDTGDVASDAPSERPTRVR